MDYKIHPNLINIMTGIYTDDRTDIVTGGETEIKMTVSSGIRQGCTASTTLFKLLTYVIIRISYLIYSPKIYDRPISSVLFRYEE